MHLVYSFGCGGMENGVANLVNHLNVEKFNPSICTITKGGLFKERVKEYVEIIELKKGEKNDIRIPFRLMQLFRKKNIHIVHAHSWGTCIDGIIGARLAGVPVIIYQEHGVGFFIEFKKRRIWARKLLKPFITQLIALSENMKKIMAEAFGIIPENNIKVIINGVDTEKFKIRSEEEKNDIRKELGLGDKIVVGTIGRMENVKDQETFLEAISILCSKGEDIRSILVGDGSLRMKLEKRKNKLLLNDNVFFLGERKDIERIFSAIDIFVLTSLNEGIPNVILEAMACGLPVVATNVGGIPEIVDDGRSGILVPPSDPLRLADAIFELLMDRDKLKTYGLYGRKLVENRFSLQKMVKGYEDIYITNLKAGKRI